MASPLVGLETDIYDFSSPIATKPVIFSWAFPSNVASQMYLSVSKQHLRDMPSYADW